MIIAEQRILVGAERRMEEAKERRHMFARGMDDALLGNGEDDQRGQVEHQCGIGAGGQFVQQTMLVAED